MRGDRPKAARRAVPVRASKASLTGIESRDALKYVSSKKAVVTQAAWERPVLVE